MTRWNVNTSALFCFCSQGYSFMAPSILFKRNVVMDDPIQLCGGFERPGSAAVARSAMMKVRSADLGFGPPPPSKNLKLTATFVGKWDFLCFFVTSSLFFLFVELRLCHTLHLAIRVQAWACLIHNVSFSSVNPGNMLPFGKVETQWFSVCTLFQSFILGAFVHVLFWYERFKKRNLTSRPFFDFSKFVCVTNIFGTFQKVYFHTCKHFSSHGSLFPFRI